MIKLACKVPKEITLAVSGGPDSMALLDFSLRGGRKVDVLHFNHGTDFSEAATTLVMNYCEQREIPLRIIKLLPVTDKNKSQEQIWSDQRRAYYKVNHRVVATAHHLDDAVEWWLMSCFRGKPRIMAVRNPEGEGIIRPFLTTEKSVLVEWCNRHEVPYLMDPTNLDGSNDRSKIRAAFGLAEIVNPGIRTTVRKMYEQELKVA